MMNDIIMVSFPKSERMYIYLTFEKYVVDLARVSTDLEKVECIFSCRKWNTRKCIRALDHALIMGHENRVVVK